LQKIILLVHINCEIFAWFFICMKIAMWNSSKNRLYLRILPVITMSFLGLWFVNAISFTERLEEMWLDVEEFSNKKSVSRYEISRLLNVAHCEDCIHSPEWMRQTYTQSFWDSFKSKDDKDFDDINYGGAVWNKKSYYYCVAYVGDNGYMAWYPSTSTKCQWKFCWQDNITMSEVYQTILNISQDKIRKNYRINWKEVKSRLNSLKRDWIEMKVLNDTNIKAINNADTNSNIAQTNDEFQAWLKYCMYNLSWCNFQRFWKIWRWYRPVSELNILYKEWIITQEDAIKVAESNSSINGADTLRIFWKVFDNYSNCTFDVDYDCDWIVNGKDNCPYAYNSNQYDADWDGVWNVCDDDIDWDWEKNPIWIVDDNNHIIISLWNDALDKTPLWDSDLWFSFFINVDTIDSRFPTSVRFSVLTNSDIEKIDWDFWDGTTKTVNNWNKLSHTFSSYWTFTVKAIAKSKNNWQAFAMTKVFIATPQSENYMLNISPSVSFKNGATEYTLTPLYSGDLDSISWDVNSSLVKSQKVSEKLKITIKESGMYLVSAKWYKNWKLKSVAMFTIVKKTSPAFAYIALKPWALWEETEITTYVASIDRNNIERVITNRWEETTSSRDLRTTHVYTEGGEKIIQQTIILKDGTKFYLMATVTVNNPLLSQSYWMSVSWKRLVYNQNEKLSLWLKTYPQTSILSLFTSYQMGAKLFLLNPDLANTILNYSYSTAWDKLLTNTVEINRCIALTNQWTIHINSRDVCKAALENKSLSNYKCDQDQDGIPDICDDDIDGDGIKNLIWIITHENKDCWITSGNINLEILKKEFWVCSLDNCPFNENWDQSDLNNNWIWNICEDRMSLILMDSNDQNKSAETEDTLVYVNDQDWDGIPDNTDECVDIPWNSANGCPQYYNQNCWIYSSCWNGEIDRWETCQNCPQDVWDCCGNWKLEARETCKTCPADAWACELCGNWVIDEWEDCKNCPQDVWECTATCWDWIIQDAEDCKNCPQDVWPCTATCRDGEIQLAEDCKNCPEDVKMCRDSTCGDGKIDKWAWEECDNWSNNGKDWKCTLKCTIYDINKPKCGNWVIDKWEDCKNCPIDLWDKCIKEDSKCWDWIIQDEEDCRNCPQDVWECTASCWNDKNEKAEDCDSCPKDVKQCKSELCGNGKIDQNEECDNWSKNGKDWKCTLKCTIYDINKPKCGNWVIDLWEDCKNCEVDLWKKCIKLCGNWVIDEWEDCKNCPQDVWECTATCWDWIIQDAEDCKNCPQDVWPCTATCRDGEIQLAEDCKNCPEDVKMCRDSTCGDGKIDKWAWEECDNWSNNGKDWKCTLKCTIYDINKPKCGNWVIDEWEDCKNCPIDLWDKCIKDEESLCWNGKRDQNEECDFMDNTKQWRWDWWCSQSCYKISKDWWLCNPEYDWKVLKSISKSNLCERWISSGFAYNSTLFEWSWICIYNNTNNYIKCKAKNSVCWDNNIWEWEDCKNCPNDLKDICIDEWYNCKCDECPEKLWEICINCKCDECPEKLWDICIDKWEDENDKCGNGEVDPWETCKTCPKDIEDGCIDYRKSDNGCGNWELDSWEECDDWADNGKNGRCTGDCKLVEEKQNDDSEDKWEIANENCNSCPCEYVDFSTVLTKWDIIRAKLWDKFRSVFYRYSNAVSVDTFMD